MISTTRKRISPGPGEYDYGLYNIDYHESGTGKFNLKNSFGFLSHRSGWGSVMEQTSSLHSDDGVYVDCFIERTFGWMKHEMFKKSMIPYVKPWVGFIHNPPKVPSWYKDFNKLESIFEDELFKESLSSCKGLYTTSNYLNTWVINNLKYDKHIPIECIYHPYAGIDIVPFTIDQYKHNHNKMVIDIGTWLRKQTSLYVLNVPVNIRKIKLWPRGHEQHSTNRNTMNRFFQEELNFLGRTNIDMNSVSNIESVTDVMYDHLLSRNIVFFDCWDTSANNIIVECLERTTPIICPRHPAIVEYIGQDYPLYYDDIDGIDDQFMSLDRIELAHLYLKDIVTTKRLHIDNFIKSLSNSFIYKNI